MYLTLEAGAQLLGIRPTTLRKYASSGRIKVQENCDSYVFDDEVLTQYRKKHKHSKRQSSPDRRVRKFDARHGEGSYERLVEMLRNSTTTYEKIGREFNLTREAIRQWHVIIQDGPKGGERQHMRAIENGRAKLFSNDLFRKFYQSAIQHFKPENIEPIPKRKCEFRTDAAMLNGREVAIRKTSKRASTRTQIGKIYSYETYMLHTCQDSAYIYYSLDNNDFLFMPTAALPERGTSYIESEWSKYHKFRNNFDAFKGA